MSLFALPDDVIRYVLVPFLPWADRINLNMVLPSAWRVSTKIKKKKILKHECYAMANESLQKIGQFESLISADERSIKFKQIMDSLNSERLLNFIKNIGEFRNACLSKTLQYIDPVSSKNEGCTELNAMMLAISCKNLHDKLVNIEPSKKTLRWCRPISFV